MHRLLFWMALFSSILIFGIGAFREYSLQSAIAVFIIISVFYAGAVILTRKPLLVSLVFSSVLLAYDIADKTKMELLRSHIQLPDIFIIGGFAKSMDMTIFTLYSDIFIIAIVVISLFLIAVFVTYKYEAKNSNSYNWKIYRVNGVLLIAVSVISGWAMLNSSYASAIKRQHINRLMSERLPPRISTTAIAVKEYLDLSNLVRSSALLQGNEENAKITTDKCKTSVCPDLIIVHVESVFDPVILKNHTQTPSLAKLLATGNNGAYGSMIANIWGGYSWISEFEVICGLNHKLFGWSGQYTHYNIAPNLAGCTPRELSEIGYSTEVLYTAPASFVNVGVAFKKYGFDRFQDAPSLGLPARQQNISDEMMVKLLIQSLSEKSKSPRLIWMSTSWNHGPHGVKFSKETEYAGPYKPKNSDGELLSDYFNRLNHTVSAMNKLKKYVDQSDRPTAIMFYGDHHPYMTVEFDPETLKRNPNIEYMTALAFYSNFSPQATNGKLEAFEKPIQIEKTFSEFLKFSNVPMGRKLRKIRDIETKCGGNQLLCNDAQRQELIEVNLN